MIKRMIPRLILPVVSFYGSLFAAQSNFVKTTTYNVDGSGAANTVVSTDYSDGLGRNIQSKLKLSETRDRVTCIYYDEAGRQKIATKPFVDTENGGEYLPGTIESTTIKLQLQNSYSGEVQAYSINEYWDDPLGRVKKTNVPGAANSAIYSRTWVFGVNPLEDKPMLDVYVEGGASRGSVTIFGGVIVRLNPVDGISKEQLLDAMYQNFLTQNPFNAPNYFLTVAMDPEEKISEQMTDLFGRTIRTFTDPGVNEVVGHSVMADSRYDINGNLLEEVPPKEGGTTILIDNSNYRYNTLGQLVWKKVPDVGGEFSYEYNDDGSLSKEILGSYPYPKRVLDYEYDNLGRLVEVREDEMPVVRKYYDGISSIPQEILNKINTGLQARFTNCKGRLICSVGYNNLESVIRVVHYYAYDDEGRVKFKATYIDGVLAVQETWYEYDVHGKITEDRSFYYGDIIKRQYTYDALGRLAKIVHVNMKSDGAVVFEKELETYTYNDLGVLTNKKYSQIASDYDITFNYDILDRLRQIGRTRSIGYGEQIPVYSKSGNILGVYHDYYNGTGGGTYGFEYRYDSLYRLTDVVTGLSTSPLNAHYEYDILGRFRKKKEGASDIGGYEYYGTSNRLKQTDRITTENKQYIYDKCGNVMVDYTKNMIVYYDWRNLPKQYAFFDRLDKAGLTKHSTRGDLTSWILYSSGVKQTGRVAMLYDADGNRVCKMDIKN